MTLTRERLEQIASSCVSFKDGHAVTLPAAEVLELVRGYQQTTINLGEINPGDGAAFFGGFAGALVGTMFERRFPQGGNPPPPAMTEAERKRYLAKVKKNAAKNRKGSSRS